MESFRLKNIVILILVLMNLCLLGLLGLRVTTGLSAQAEAREQMVQLYAAEGVFLDGDLISGTTPPAGLTLTRDTAEAASPPIRMPTAAPSFAPTAPLTW